MKNIFLKMIFSAGIIVANLSYGLGLGVTKSILNVEVKPGETFVDSSLCVFNPNPSYWRVSASIKNSSQYNEYEPIPDLSWLKIETEDLVVPPKSKNTSLKFSISIPDSPYYYNRRFSAKADILFGSGGTFVPGVVVPVLISTSPSPDIPMQCPSCKVEIYPNVVSLETNSSDTVVVLNWDTVEVNFNIGFGSRLKPRFVNWLELYVRTKSGWQKNPETISISPREKSVLKIKALAPFQIYYLYLISENLTKAVKITWKGK